MARSPRRPILLAPSSGPLTVDETHAAVGLGVNGVGVIYGAEPVLGSHLKSGALKVVLSDWSTMAVDSTPIYSSRRQVPTALRLLIDLIREVDPLGKLSTP